MKPLVLKNTLWETSELFDMFPHKLPISFFHSYYLILLVRDET